MIYSLFIYAVFLFILLYGIRPQGLTSEDGYLSSFNSLRGLFALEIVVGHVVRYESSLLYPLGKFMIVSVAYFFFVSAYGLSLSMERKPDYLRGFLQKKCAYLVLIALLAYIFSLIAGLISGQAIGSSDVILGFFTETNWYIWELIFFYVLFYIGFRFIKKGRLAFIFAATLLLCLFCFYIGLQQAYYSSAFGFFAGLLFHRYFDEIRTFLWKKRGLWLTALMLILGLMSLMLSAESLMGMVLRNIMCISVLMLLYYFLSYLSPQNPILSFLGRYSAEIYLYQFVFLDIFEGLDYRLGIPVVLLCTLISALIMHPLDALIQKKLQKVFSKS